MHRNVKWIIYGFMVILFVVVFWGVSFAATYYVATDGNNENPGTYSSPWATPGYGASHLSPGDTLIIRSGTYILSDYEADILRPPSGSSSSMTTIKGEDGGHVILAGRDNLAMAIDLGGKSNIHLVNLEITHDPTGEAVYFREGISIVGSPESYNLIFDNLYIHYVDEFGIDAQDVNGLQLLNSQIEYCGFGAFGGPAGSSGTGHGRTGNPRYIGRGYQGVITF